MSINSTDSSVVIIFDQNIDGIDIKSGSVDKPVSKKYFDIKAALAIKPNIISTPFLESKYAQFSPDVVRVVFAAPKETNFTTKRDGNKLIISWTSTATFETNTMKLMDFSTKEQAAPEPKSAFDIPTKQDVVQPKKELPKAIMQKKLVVLDPGHGGKDPGATGVGGRMEKNIVLSIAKYAKEELQSRGYSVIMTRSNDTFIELKERTAFANEKNADIFVSIHANAVDTKKTNASAHHGVETYFLSPARSERAMRVSALENGEDMEEMNALSKGAFLNFLNREKIVASNKLAIDYQKAALANIHAKYPSISDGGVREAPFWVLVGAQMPAILIEVGYVSHPQEGVIISEQTYQMLIAKAIADGIDAYLANQ